VCTNYTRYGFSAVVMGLQTLMQRSYSHYLGCVKTCQYDKECFHDFIYLTRIRDSAVGIATGYRLDDRGVGVPVPVGSRIFSSPCHADRLWGPPSLLSNGYRGSFPGGKAGRETDHSTPTSAEVKKMWIYTSTPPYAFIALSTGTNLPLKLFNDIISSSGYRALNDRMIHY
jgi:hypothetical protein